MDNLDAALAVRYECRLELLNITAVGTDKPDVVIGSYKEEVLEDKGSF